MSGETRSQKAVRKAGTPILAALQSYIAAQERST